MPAALLVSGKCRVENVPDISDVRILLDILEGMGVKLAYPEPHVVELDSSEVQCTTPDPELVKKMRASYYLMGALLGRFGHAHVALPGGCNFASRPIDQHIKGFLALVIAGLSAQGTTQVEDIHYVERGYEDLIGKLTALGADIRRVED